MPWYITDWFMKLLGRVAVDKPPPEPVKPKTMAVLTRERFIQLTDDIVIPHFESGYYHPDMALKMNAADRALLAASGETHFGLDRKAGARLAVYPEWKEFWSMIDKVGARLKWKHYYMGGEFEKPLKTIASKIMYQWFNHLSAKYLIGNSIEKIAADDRLVIHFAYACWNGEGWFKKFAVALNAATGTKERIFQNSIEARTMASSKAIRNAGAKMVQLFKTMGLS